MCMLNCLCVHQTEPSSARAGDQRLIAVSKMGLFHSPQSTGLGKIQLMTDGVDTEISCLYHDSSQMTTGRERQCFLRNLLTLQMSVTEATWKLGQALCTMLCFFSAIMKYTQQRKIVSETNSSGDITAEIKAVSSSSMRSWLFGHCISNTSYIGLHLSPVPS